MAVYFWDTSALVYRYAEGLLSRRVRQLVSDSRKRNYIADHSVLEMASALGRECRRNSLGIRNFDSMEMAFMRDIAEGRLEVMDTARRDFERARHLIRYVGMKAGRKISSGDALVATCCLEFVLDKREEDIAFISCDLPLFEILKSLDAFTTTMKLWHWDKNTGRKTVV